MFGVLYLTDIKILFLPHSPSAAFRVIYYVKLQTNTQLKKKKAKKSKLKGSWNGFFYFNMFIEDHL